MSSSRSHALGGEPALVSHAVRADAEESENRPLLQSDDDDLEDQSSVRHSTQWDRYVEPSLVTVQPQAWEGTTAIRQNFIRQILGLNPVKTSYFALYRPLDDVGSRTILASGILLAMYV